MEENEKIEKAKKPIYKKWWFWVIVVVIVLALGLGGNSSNNTTTGNNASTNDNTSINDKKQDNKVEVTIVDFSTMTREEVQNWIDNNKMKGTISDEYSETVEKGNFVSQSIAPNTISHEGDTITIVYSLGKQPTTEEKNALKKAESYSNNMHMSKAKIYQQLTSEYGEAFSAEAAQYAIDNIQADWNANALAKAKSYQSTMNMSKARILQQLTSEYGEKFTQEEAQYAIDHLED